jgi:anion-transporting  ArsA/GET3 family ATPase
MDPQRARKLTLLSGRGYENRVSGLPLFDRRLVIVTGKGGVGKSAVAMAAALAAAVRKHRTLLVELASTGTLTESLGLAQPLGSEPRRVRANLSAARLDPREAIEDFVRGLLPIGFLSRRLLGSWSFRTVVAAAPGIDEFLALYRIARWEGERRAGSRRARYDLVVVDAPATGHSLPLLGAPDTFLRMVPVGPFASLAGRLRALINDPARTVVAVVTMPDEMAVNEAIELYQQLDRELQLPLAPPIVNAVLPQRFSREEAQLIQNGAGAVPEWEPYAAAARFELARRRAADAHIRRLRAALATSPVRLPYVFTPALTLNTIGPLADALAAAATSQSPHQVGKVQ